LEDHPYEALIIAAYNLILFLKKVKPSTDLLDMVMVMQTLHILQVPVMRTRCLQLRGDMLGAMGQYDQAITELEEAERKFKEMEEKSSATECLQSLGDILRLQGRYPEAQKKLEEAQNEFEQIGEQLGT